MTSKIIRKKTLRLFNQVKWASNIKMKTSYKIVLDSRYEYLIGALLTLTSDPGLGTSHRYVESEFLNSLYDWENQAKV